NDALLSVLTSDSSSRSISSAPTSSLKSQTAGKLKSSSAITKLGQALSSSQERSSSLSSSSSSSLGTNTNGPQLTESSSRVTSGSKETSVQPPTLDGDVNRGPLGSTKINEDSNNHNKARDSATRQLADELIKSKLRSKHLKRTPTIGFINNNSNENVKEEKKAANNNEQAEQLAQPQPPSKRIPVESDRSDSSP